MKYHKLGHSGLSVSRIGLGSYLTFGSHVSLSQAQQCIKKAFELGIIFFDTADSYPGAEECLGEVLTLLPREELVIATKCFFPTSANPNCQGLSRKHIFSSIDRSLKKLKTDYIDLYQCHRYDPTTPLLETMQAMSDLIKLGKIRYWGVSQWSAQQVEEACLLANQRQLPPPISNQCAYNLFNQTAEKDIFLPGQQLGIGGIGYYPLSQGVLSGKYLQNLSPQTGRASHPSLRTQMKDLTEEAHKKISQLAIIAKKLNITLAQLSIAWCLRNDSVNAVIVGATQVEQIIENAKSVTLSDTETLWKEIEEIVKGPAT